MTQDGQRAAWEPREALGGSNGPARCTVMACTCCSTGTRHHLANLPLTLTLTLTLNQT